MYATLKTSVSDPRALRTEIQHAAQYWTAELDKTSDPARRQEISDHLNALTDLIEALS